MPTTAAAALGTFADHEETIGTAGDGRSPDNTILPG
jgi:hypothetical protein